MLNFIAVEPVVNGTMEFSEISPSQVDGKWGKLMWAGDHANAPAYRPFSISRGVITHPDPTNPAIGELSLYLIMEQFLNGAHPYHPIYILSDSPEELGLDIFTHEDSSPMAPCTFTATSGNFVHLQLFRLEKSHY